MLAVERDAAARYDDMDVRMMCERRSPGVQHGGEPDARARCLGSAAMVIRVSAATLSNRSLTTALL